ncbi:MAG: YhdH/YhfP family quinone oxidoreductase [Bdellovibrionota bacterium]|nr:YhdH/YhfP family quinone oxidoreductase [Bdellovibrionota bacterium]
MDSFNAFRVYKKDKKISGLLEKTTLEELDQGDVVIKAHYSSINFKDALGALGKGQIFKKFPTIGGIDVSGVVESSDNPKFKKGDSVLVTGCGLGETHDGGYSEFVRVPSDWVVPLPENLSLKEAMIYGTAGFTSSICVHRMEANDQSPDKGPIVVTGASGGVGSFGVMMMSKLGYEVHAISNKKESHDYLKSLGAHKVLSLEELDLGARPLEKGRYGGAIDNLGGDCLGRLIPHVNLWGNVASVGLAMGHTLNATVMPFILRGVSLLGISSANCPMELRLKLWDRVSKELKSDNLSDIVFKEIPLSDIEKSCEELLERKVSGRILVKI